MDLRRKVIDDLPIELFRKLTTDAPNESFRLGGSSVTSLQTDLVLSLSGKLLLKDSLLISLTVSLSSLTDSGNGEWLFWSMYGFIAGFSGAGDFTGCKLSQPIEILSPCSGQLFKRLHPCMHNQNINICCS